MKGVYLTKEGKQELETKIAELEKLALSENLTGYGKGGVNGKLTLLKEMLSSAIILPVAEEWGDVDFIHDYSQQQLSDFYPDGVIIQSKK